MRINRLAKRSNELGKLGIHSPLDTSRHKGEAFEQSLDERIATTEFVHPESTRELRVFVCELTSDFS
jgi:hypothetical protein